MGGVSHPRRFRGRNQKSTSPLSQKKIFRKEEEEFVGGQFGWEHQLARTFPLVTNSFKGGTLKRAKNKEEYRRGGRWIAFGGGRSGAFKNGGRRYTDPRSTREGLHL